MSGFGAKWTSSAMDAFFAPISSASCLAQPLRPLSDSLLTDFCIQSIRSNNWSKSPRTVIYVGHSLKHILGAKHRLQPKKASWPSDCS